MGEIIVPFAVVRKPNYIYYIDREGNLCEAEMTHGRKKKDDNKNKKEDN